jgi:putative nucleotidyltransferase with HDIG domain
VARLQGRIVGQGGTPEEARLAAQGERYKEKAEISYMHAESPMALPPLLDAVTALADDQEIHLVGGAVRDALLGTVSHDFDLVVPKNAINMARRVAGGLGADFYVLDESFDAARVIVTNASGIRDVLDFTSFRGPDLVADLAGRDFTINAIALDLKARTTLDPKHGAIDVREKRIRACSPSALKDDPIRILRGVRLAAALGFTIEAATRQSMKSSASLLQNTSTERRRDELFRILGGARPDASLRALEMLGVFPHFLPELTALKGVHQPTPHVHDAWEHTLGVMDHLAEILDLLLEDKLEGANGLLISRLMLGIGRYRAHLAEHYRKSLNEDRSLRALLLLAALLHDVGKPSTRSVDEDGRIHFLGHEREGARLAVQRAVGLNLSNAETARLGAIIQHHLRFFFLARRMEEAGEAPSRRAIYRFFRDAGNCAVDLILLGLADLRGARGHTLTEETWAAWVDTARVLLENLWERPAESVAPPRLLDGNGLMQALGLQPGPLVGRLLEAIRESQAAGDVSTAEGALEFARAWLARHAD